VSHAWLVEPLLQTLEVFSNDAAGWRVVGVHGENEIVRVAPFEKIEIDLALLWGAPPTKERASLPGV
jgi:hypothetical protein